MGTGQRRGRRGHGGRHRHNRHNHHRHHHHIGPSHHTRFHFNRRRRNRHRTGGGITLGSLWGGGGITRQHAEMPWPELRQTQCFKIFSFIMVIALAIVIIGIVLIVQDTFFLPIGAIMAGLGGFVLVSGMTCLCGRFRQARTGGAVISTATSQSSAETGQAGIGLSTEQYPGMDVYTTQFGFSQENQPTPGAAPNPPAGSYPTQSYPPAAGYPGYPPTSGAANSPQGTTPYHPTQSHHDGPPNYSNIGQYNAPPPPAGYSAPEYSPPPGTDYPPNTQELPPPPTYEDAVKSAV